MVNLKMQGIGHHATKLGRRIEEREMERKGGLAKDQYIVWDFSGFVWTFIFGLLCIFWILGSS